jgi:hypothetical protein
MGNQSFHQYNCDLLQLQKSIAPYFIGRGYAVTNFFKEKIYVTQAYKPQLGSKALICKLEGTHADFQVYFGLSERIANINFLQTIENLSIDCKILLGDPLLERNFFNFVSTQAELKRNTFGLFHLTTVASSPFMKEREIIIEIEVTYCRHCGQKNNARLANCTHCNASLH